MDLANLSPEKAVLLVGIFLGLFWLFSGWFRKSGSDTLRAPGGLESGVGRISDSRTDWDTGFDISGTGAPKFGSRSSANANVPKSGFERTIDRWVGGILAGRASVEVRRKFQESPAAAIVGAVFCFAFLSEIVIAAAVLFAAYAVMKWKGGRSDELYGIFKGIPPK